MITATYSPEDNKLRLYASERLDEETFERVKDAGYRWAPKQELFVAPKWTTRREDLALELAGSIEPEDMTMAERAQAKSDRLAGIAQKRATEASAYSRRASELSEAFHMGQPILVGHHSERKARKTQEKMHSASDNAVKAARAVDYWAYRAEGVERHANYKNKPAVRARRIKTLLAELRDLQRTLNRAHKTVELWTAAKTPELIERVAGSFDHTLKNLWSDIRDGKVTHEDARTRAIEAYTKLANSLGYQRTIAHTLHRLAYEREFLGEVPRYGGEITETTLQMFLREHGADKPKASKVDADLFTVECQAPLPAHIGDGLSLEMNADEWRDLMQSVGYVPPAKKPAKPPLLNLDIDEMKTDRFGTIETRKVVHMTKAEHKQASRYDRGWVELSVCKQFRFRTVLDPTWTGPSYSAPRIAVFLTDSKAHAAPEVTA